MNPQIRKYMQEIGRKGGKAGKRQLTTEEARRMAAASAKARAAKRAGEPPGTQKGTVNA